LGAAPIVVPQPCPAGTVTIGDGTCEAPAVVVQPAPVISAPIISTPTCPSGTVFSEGSCLTLETAPVSSGEYCYGNGKALYDSRGHKIKGSKNFDHSSCKGH